MPYDFKQITSKLNNLSQREKNLVSGLLIVFSTIPFFQVTIPAWNNYTESKSKISMDKSKLSNLELNIRKLEKLKKENQIIAKKIEGQKLYLAKSYELDFLAQDLKKICDESSITLESFTPSNAEPINIILDKQATLEIAGQNNNRRKAREAIDKLKEQNFPVDLYRFPIEVKVSGNFTDIVDLFKKLENYGRVISIENISIGKVQAKQAFQNRLSKAKSKKEKKDTGSLLSTFDLIAYSLPWKEETLSYSELQRSTAGLQSSFTYKRKKR